MTILTRPDDGLAKPETKPDDEWKTAPVRMSVQLANALVTSAPLSVEEMHVMRVHFIALVALLDVSGPMFSSMRRQAVDMHNKVVRRINGVADEVRRRALMEDPDRLLEIDR
ncbi:MAG TPA: hypothetical protein VH024_17320 [Candidatus Angelobacter sp.]|jgi:hypothetical protein|nr:hypothetical protein [Candidatus Angelobacter sp.]